MLSDSVHPLATSHEVALWVNDGLLAAPDIARLSAEGVELTNFTRWIDPADQEAIASAVETIKQHRPCQVLYIERSWSKALLSVRSGHR